MCQRLFTLENRSSRKELDGKTKLYYRLYSFKIIYMKKDIFKKV